MNRIVILRIIKLIIFILYIIFEGKVWLIVITKYWYPWLLFVPFHNIFLVMTLCRNILLLLFLCAAQQQNGAFFLFPAPQRSYTLTSHFLWACLWAFHISLGNLLMDDVRAWFLIGKKVKVKVLVLWLIISYFMGLGLRECRNLV